MLDFTYHVPTKVVFGRGGESQLAALIAAETPGKTVLLHYGGGSVKRSGLYGRLTALLQNAGYQIVALGGAQPNPRIELAREGVRLAKETNADFVLAVGGGSVIDSAKAIALGALYDGDVWDFYEGLTPVERLLPVGCVLTIAAAGSEMSDGTVLTSGERKVLCKSPLFAPRFSILNPENTFTLPAYQTACGAADIASHIMERYFSNTAGVDLSTRLLEAALKTILIAGPCAVREPDNYDVRAEVMWCGTVGHNDILGVGRDQDWASHMIEHELSGLYDIAHGAGLAVITPAWMKYAAPRRPAFFARFAREVFGVDASDPARAASLAIERMESWFRSLGLPVRLREAGITRLSPETVAARVIKAGRGSVGSFVPLDEQAVLRILTIADDAP